MGKARKVPNLAAYEDVKQVLSQALMNEGLRVQLEDRKQATRFRQRCYMYRAALLRLAAESTAPGVTATTPFDDVFIQLEKDTDAAEPHPGALVFSLHSRKPLPKITTLDGRPVDPATAPAFEPIDDLDTIEPPDFENIDFGDLE